LATVDEIAACCRVNNRDRGYVALAMACEDRINEMHTAGADLYDAICDAVCEYTSQRHWGETETAPSSSAHLTSANPR
jgi:transcription elongation factor Elf1